MALTPHRPLLVLLSLHPSPPAESGVWAEYLNSTTSQAQQTACRRRTFTIVGDARADGRIRVNKVPRVNAVATRIEEGGAIAAFAANFDP